MLFKMSFYNKKDPRVTEIEEVFKAFLGRNLGVGGWYFVRIEILTCSMESYRFGELSPSKLWIFDPSKGQKSLIFYTKNDPTPKMTLSMSMLFKMSFYNKNDPKARLWCLLLMTIKRIRTLLKMYQNNVPKGVNTSPCSVPSGWRRQKLAAVASYGCMFVIFCDFWEKFLGKKTWHTSAVANLAWLH